MKIYWIKAQAPRRVLALVKHLSLKAELIEVDAKAGGLKTPAFAALNPNMKAPVLRVELQLGINTGTWSYLAEWKPRDVFQPGFGDFIAELDTYDLRLRKRFSADLFDGLQPGLFQASLAAGYVAATPHFFARDFAEMEVEMVQRLSRGFVFTIAPKLELSDYLNFAGSDREDAIVSLRLIPAYNFSDGVTLSLEGQASIAFSTLETKAGETWSLTPILRMQKAL